MNSKVYIINSAGHDYSKAAQFGTLTILTEGSLPIFAVDRIKEMCIEGLENFDCRYDYLLLSGNLVPNIIATGVALMKSRGHITVLIFDAKRRIYIERQLDFSGIQTNLKEEDFYGAIINSRY